MNADQARAFDRWAIEDVGVPSLVLMENASRAVVDEVLALRAGSALATSRPVRVLCGPGNNGGDGVAVVRLLASEGVATIGHLIGDARSDSDLARQIEIARALRLDVRKGMPRPEELHDASLLVDALFGTGLTRPLEGELADLVHQVNSADAPVVAVDLPSGLDANHGALIGPVVRADHTVTFPLPKVAHQLFPAAEACGRVVVRSLGVPPQDLAGPRVDAVLMDRVARELPSRPSTAHKGTFGRVLVVAGSVGFEGAAVLAASAAVAGGAGLVRLVVPAGCRAHLGIRPEVMVEGVGDAHAPGFGLDALDQVLERAQGQDVLVLGPGMGAGDATRRFCGSLLESWAGPCIVDADALRAVSVLESSAGSTAGRVQPPILTPHPGELARMLERPTEEIVSDPLASASEAAERWGAVVALKGRSTVVAEPTGRSWINTTGGPLLASGGSGDVLAGLAGALEAAGLDAARAARCAVFVHGMAADRLSSTTARVGLGAGALCSAIPEALESCYQAASSSSRGSVPATIR